MEKTDNRFFNLLNKIFFEKTLDTGVLPVLTVCYLAYKKEGYKRFCISIADIKESTGMHFNTVKKWFHYLQEKKILYKEDKYYSFKPLKMNSKNISEDEYISIFTQNDYYLPFMYRQLLDKYSEAISSTDIDIYVNNQIENISNKK